MDKSIAIIGAGIAGLAAGTVLAAAGRQVVLFDKGRGPGGRMATRRMPPPLGEASFDHGTQFFTARDPAFAAQVERWVSEGLAARWPAAGPDAWVGTPGMNAPLRAMAAGLDVHWSTEITAIAHSHGGWHLEGTEGRFDTLVIAIPAEQAARLLGPAAPDLAASAAAVTSAPSWTVMAAFAEPLPLSDVPQVSRALGWAARNSAKPGRTSPESWVLQATAEWSYTHLESPADVVIAALLQALGTDLPIPVATAAHRWRYAFPAATGAAPIWDESRALGLCGDWLASPRVGEAWSSGTAVAGMILNG
ncbi:NAD/FAD-dependent oxidoreductase [Polymorphobacter multimanifer]|uniref:NAD(P)/FAD-dependent oxidoreductase n=1 Tax=Polymorphobacter multimanifer TaxID=1070431 RepID=UPI001664322A|nr:FAD-dependent oxidoreductase [Polymorphobacter multimanifer]GGI77441.1 NAD/FAD-dependent oxidoreductase [Polymorphobacter multimanifer]